MTNEYKLTDEDMQATRRMKACVEACERHNAEIDFNGIEFGEAAYFSHVRSTLPDEQADAVIELAYALCQEWDERDQQEAREVKASEKYAEIQNALIEDYQKAYLIQITSEYLLLKYHFISHGDNFNRAEIMVYAKGIFESQGEHVINNFCQTMFKKKASQGFRNEVVLRVRTATYVQELPDPAKNMVCFANGVLDTNRINNPVLLPHSPKYLLQSRIPHNFHPDAKCPDWITFLSQIVNEKALTTLQMMFGHCLLQSMTYHNFFVLVGAGRNGKSTLLAVLERMLGRKNVSNLPLEDMGHRFRTKELRGKLSNICPDISDIPPKNTSMLKATTGGDRVMGEVKGGSIFSFESFATQIYSANQLPDLKENTFALWSRVVLINFPNTFEGSDAKRGLKEELCGEMSGIVAWSVEGLRKLQEAGGFNVKPELVKREYSIRRDPAFAFLYSRCILDPQATILKTTLMAKYSEWCDAKGVYADSYDLFCRKVLELTGVKAHRMKIDRGGEREHVFKGVRWIGNKE